MARARAHWTVVWVTVVAGTLLGLPVAHASSAVAVQADAVEQAAPQPDAIPPKSIVWHPWPLFDPYLAPRSTVVSGGPTWERSSSGAGPRRGGFELLIGRTMETRRSVLFTRLELEYGLRVTGGDAWVVSLPRYSYVSGLLLGPVEVAARVGVSLMQVHFGSGGFGAGFFSPRVAAGVAVRAGPVRIGALAFSEFAWRWFGGPDARVDGLVLELEFGGRPDGLPSHYRVEP
jgi:hypothetical protein